MPKWNLWWNSMEDEDSHYCLRCRTTIQGLDNYVLHRREKCQTKGESSNPPPAQPYLNIPRTGGTPSGSLMSRSYLDVRSKSSRSDPVLASSSTHMEADRFKHQDVGEPNPLVAADLSVEVSADDFMSHLGLCMVSSTPWAADMASEEPLRADDFFSLLELQSCSKTSERHRQRRSIEPLQSGDRLRSDVFADLNSSHDSATADVTMDISGSEELDASGLPGASFESPVPGTTTPAVEEVIQSCNSAEEAADSVPNADVPTQLPPSPSKLTFPSRGKWMPGLKPRDIHKSGSSVEYHCKPCNRRLTGRVVFEKHLQSELHFKRSAQQLAVTNPTAEVHYGLRQKKLDPSKREVQPEEEGDNSKQPVLFRSDPSIDVLEEDTDMWWMKRKKKGEKNAQRCPICSVWVPRPLFGKHLVSRYHVSRSRNHPQRNQCVLDYIHLIVLEAPFQCHLCRFYCHSHADLLAHWKSPEHAQMDLASTGRTFSCSLCRVNQLDGSSMGTHIDSEQHLSCVDIVNKSVAVVVSKLVPIQCHLCRASHFRYRAQLNHHLASKHSVPARSMDQHCGRVFSCDHCDYKTPSSSAFTHHVFSCRAVPSSEVKYRCLVCDLSFPTKEEVVRHRSTQEHRDVAGSKRSGSSLPTLRSCPHCYKSFTDLASLKAHFMSDHPDLLPRCSRCGATFALKQQLSAHRRTSCSPAAELLEQPPLACDVPSCSFRCRTRLDLLYHQAVEHRDGEVGLREEGSSASGTTSTAKYRCPDCGGSYSSKFSLKAHLQTHRSELAFRCHHCGRHFEREEERLAHIRQLHAPRPHIKGRLQSMTKKKKGHSTPGATSSGLSPASRAPSMSAPGVCR